MSLRTSRFGSSVLPVSVAALTFSLFLAPLTAQAVLYAPGATLDPSCLPTDLATCGITSVVGTGTANNIPYYATDGAVLSATSTFTILPVGNVGIGTTTPARLFSVQGNALFSGNLTVASLTATGTVAFATALPITSGGTGLSSVTANRILYSDASGAFAQVATTSLTLGSGLSYSGTLGSFIGGASGSLTISTSSLYTGTAGQNAYFSGTGTLVGTSTLFIATNRNVGIGTTTPFAFFTLYKAGSTAATSPQLVLSASTTIAGTSGLFNWAIGTDLNDQGKFKISSSSVIGTNDRFIIDGSGNVAIGTTTPFTLLTLYKAGATAANSPQLVFSASSTVTGNTTALTNWTIGTDLNDFGKFKISSSSVIGTADRFVINGAGNVGIGTSTPQWTFQISATRPSLALSDTAAGPNLKHWLLSSVNGNLYLGTSTDQYATSSPSVFTFLANGDTGTGTSTPGADFSITNETGLGPAFLVGSNTNATQFIIDQTGRIGIATTSPAGLLSVEQGTENYSFWVGNQGSSTAALAVGGVNMNGIVMIATSTNNSFATTSVLIVGNSNITTGSAIATFGSAGGICSINNAGLSCSSDRSLKTNITPLPSALETLMALTPVTYNWKSEQPGSPVHAGFIAQEVMPLIPDLVTSDLYGNKALNYAGFTPYIISAVQQLAEQVVNLAQSITTTALNAVTGTFTHVKTQDLCIGDTCVTESQLQELLRQSGQEASQPPTEPSPQTDSTTQAASGTSEEQAGAPSSDADITNTDSTVSSDAGVTVSTDPIITAAN